MFFTLKTKLITSWLIPHVNLHINYSTQFFKNLSLFCSVLAQICYVFIVFHNSIIHFAKYNQRLKRRNQCTKQSCSYNKSGCCILKKKKNCRLAVQIEYNLLFRAISVFKLNVFVIKSMLCAIPQKRSVSKKRDSRFHILLGIKLL